MSAKQIFPKQRLRQLVGRGTPASKLIASAAEKLDAVRETSVAEIGALVDRLQELGRELGGDADPAKVQRLYQLSNEIYGIAGTFGLIHLGKAAYSLCDLLDQLGVAQTWNWPAVRVHLDSIRLLRTRQDQPEAERDAIIEGLLSVVSHVTAAASAKRTAPSQAPAAEGAK
jgi:hypothetical protein